MEGVFIDVFALQVGEHDVFVDVGKHFEQFGSIFLRFALHIFGDIDDVIACTKVFALPYDCIHGDEINNSSEVRFCADGELEHGDVGV